MQIPPSVKNAFYTAVTFFGTLIVLSVGYGALTWGLSTADKVGSGSGLTSTSWNRIVEGILDLDGRVSNFSFVGGNVGIGAVSPSAKLSVAGDIIGNAQVFRAYMTTDYSHPNSWKKLPFNAVAFNTLQGTFDTTNNRFIPSRAGYYQISVTGHSSTASANNDRNVIGVLKNGVWEGVAGGNYSAGDTPLAGPSTIVYLNGSTDYVEIYMFSAIPAVIMGGPGWHSMRWHMNYLGS